MKHKNTYWIIAGLLNLLTFFAHLIGGQVELVNPMIDKLSLEISSQLVGAWHMVTIILLATSYILLSAGFGKKYATNIELIKSIGYLNLSFCLPFIVAGFYYRLLVPQWIFFLPIGLFTIFGLNKTKIVSIATSVLFIYLFSLLFFMSDSFVKDLGLEASLTSLVIARRAAMFMLGIAVLTFTSRNLPSSKVRQIICLSIGIQLFGLSCIGTYDFINGHVNASIIVAITIETILWLLYGIILIKDRKVESRNVEFE